MSRSDGPSGFTADSPACGQKSAEPIEVTTGSGNVFRDIGMPHPGVEWRLAGARIAGLPKPITVALAKLVGAAIEATDEQEPGLVAALDSAIAAIMGAELPAEMTLPIEEVLGLPNFRTGPTAHLFRAAGAKIKTHFEEEQAYVLFLFLHLALKHGTGWAREADRLVAEARAVVEAKKAAERVTEPEP